MEDFLVQNWAQTDLGKEYDIYEEEGERVGQQYPTDTGPIDILAISKDRKQLLVVELKKGRASDVVVGQVLRYMGYVQEELSEEGQTVHGVIIALEDDQRIRRAIARLQAIDGEALALGDDSGLQNTWDEICVQVQSEKSFGWAFYDETVRACVQADVEEHPKHEREAIWLQTPQGLDWEGEEDAVAESCPVDDSEILNYLLAEYVYATADRWSNARIRKYLDR